MMMAATQLPWNREAEQATLGAYVVDARIRSEIDAIVGPDDYFDPSHKEVARALRSMVEQDQEITPVTLAEELDRRGKLDVVPRLLIATLLDAVGTTTSSASHATIVKKRSTAREVARIAGRLADVSANGCDTAALAAATEQLSDLISPTDEMQSNRSVDGSSFVFSTPEVPPAICGEGEHILWASGEALMIVGPSGVGKTTVAQQIILGRLGVRDRVLGLPVLPAGQRVLYVAADRPTQAARSFNRMANDDDKSTLEEGLTVWRGPLPFDLAQEPRRFASFIADHGAATVVIDSLKDVALDLSKDETGARVNHAVQLALAQGIEVLVLHHQRKAQAGAGKPRKIDDVYGSTWLTAGAGSVVLLWGEPGDLIVDFVHLKQPAENVGPLKLLHDHTLGHTEIVDGFDPLTFIRKRATGVTAQEIAVAMSEKSVPNRNDVEKARRKLEGLARKGLVHRQEGARGGRGESRNPARYFPISRQEDPR